MLSRSLIRQFQKTQALSVGSYKMVNPGATNPDNKTIVESVAQSWFWSELLRGFAMAVGHF